MKKNVNIIKRFFPDILRNVLPRTIFTVEISKKESSRINGLYRKIKKPTNVLSFRYGDDYGEILICPQIIRQEAKKTGYSYTKQMTWMILHGMIHLAGLHHEKSAKSQARFVRLEKEILDKLF